MTLWLLFFTSFLLLYGALLLVWWRAVSARMQKQMVNAIQSGLRPPEGIAKPTILVEPQRTQARGLAGFFQSGPAAPGEQAGWSPGKWTALTIGTGLAGLMIGFQFRGLLGISALVLGTAAGAILPWMFRARKTRKRLAAIEEQFPEALDCLSRSIRAGNAFSVAIELLVAETQEPLQTEIRKLTRETALGARLEDALNGLIARVPLVEVRFFVSAVLLQRETGGNLSEVIGKLAASLRERFKIRGQVKAASGQGRLTANVLTVLPLVTTIMLRFASPDYLRVLTEDAMGRNLMAAAAVFQIIGYIVMKRVINIEV